MIDAFIKAGFRFESGDVLTVTDQVIRFPKTLGRRAHARRFVLLLTKASLFQQNDVILIAPMSGSSNELRGSNLEFVPSELNGLEKRSTVYLDHIQPILKQDIKQHVGRLSADDWDRVMFTLVRNIDRE